MHNHWRFLQYYNREIVLESIELLRASTWSFETAPKVPDAFRYSCSQVTASLPVKHSSYCRIFTLLRCRGIPSRNPTTSSCHCMCAKGRIRDTSSAVSAMQCVTIRVALNAPVSEEAEDEEALHALLPPTVLHELSQSISTVPSAVVRAEYAAAEMPNQSLCAVRGVVFCFFKYYNLIG